MGSFPFHLVFCQDFNFIVISVFFPLGGDSPQNGVEKTPSEPLNSLTPDYTSPFHEDPQKLKGFLKLGKATKSFSAAVGSPKPARVTVMEVSPGWQKPQIGDAAVTAQTEGQRNYFFFWDG
jgi:hypothetical protein